MVYLCKYIYKWIKDFLSGRKQKVIINGKTSKTVNSHKWSSSGESECCRTNILLRFYKLSLYAQNFADDAKICLVKFSTAGIEWNQSCFNNVITLSET